MHLSHFLSLLSRTAEWCQTKRTTKRQTLRTYAHIFLRQEVSKKKQRREGEKKKKKGYIIQSSGFALTSTQGVTSLPHNSTKSCHSAIPITTTAFLLCCSIFHLGLGCVWVIPQASILKLLKALFLVMLLLALPQPWLFLLCICPRNTWAAAAEQGSCHQDQCQQLEPSDHGNIRTAGVVMVGSLVFWHNQSTLVYFLKDHTYF